jgi:hypothetical protein
MDDSLTDFEHFSQALESLKGRFRTYELEDEWVNRILKLLAESPN